MRRSDLYWLSSQPFFAVSVTSIGNIFTWVMTMVLSIFGLILGYAEDNNDKQAK